MELIKICLNKDESELYNEAHEFAKMINVALYLYKKTEKLINLKEYEVVDVEIDKELSDLYSMSITLVEKTKNVKK